MSRNSFRLLNDDAVICIKRSTQVEILLGYLTLTYGDVTDTIYTSRNSSRLPNISENLQTILIYTSRNSSRLLN